jgi:hypothetical protein
MGDRFGVYEYTATNGPKRGLVEIKRALEELPLRNPRVERQLPQ